MTAAEFIEESVAGMAGAVILAMAICVAIVAYFLYFVLSSIVTLFQAVTE